MGSVDRGTIGFGAFENGIMLGPRVAHIRGSNRGGGPEQGGRGQDSQKTTCRK